ncbi:MAG: hypothetical protein AABX33_05285 [Nanoarchaeota archaeon]
MKIAIDSCSVILLAKATVLEAVASNYDLLISDNVYKEILQGKDKKFIDALVTEKLVKDGKLKISKVKEAKIIKKLIRDFSLGIGEAETLAFVLGSQCEAISTDNKQGRKVAKIYNLNLIGSIDLIISLFKLKIIDNYKAISALKMLKEFGWFQDYLIDSALEEVKNV